MMKYSIKRSKFKQYNVSQKILKIKNKYQKIKKSYIKDNKMITNKKQITNS